MLVIPKPNLSIVVKQASLPLLLEPEPNQKQGEGRGGEMATATVAGVSLSTPRVLAKATETTKAFQPARLSNPWRRSGGQQLLGGGRMMMIRPVSAAPDKISEKVAESIKSAEETCSDDPASGECVAAWDEVEELSAAASHARDNKKTSDPLETYCKDNPETDECRTYDN